MKKSLKEILINSLKSMRFILPIFFISVLLSVLIDQFIPDSIIQLFLGKNFWIAVPVAAILGAILPIPRYATYPIAFTLFEKGASMGVIFALICGEVIVESIVRDVMEVKYFGWRFFTSRLFISIVFITIGGYIVAVVL
ncbi:hypothetical protein HN958_01995 [Candidatus Falkowbacteria bacterium]|jgi:uncharacterized protein|nr:hypothetical protein [Candidatus Falkowbacteria bacterium]MBT7007256.1 hypothetical protein [Candidatus Falkowbacteria bacterium]